MPETPRFSFRLPALTLERIDRISEDRGGLTRTRVIELAVDHLYREVFPLETVRPVGLRTRRRERR
jgi:metal-responsive CopG/Arc/MetJ family transcriptional regulator